MLAHRLAAIALAATFPLAACTQDQPLADEGAEVPGGAVGPDEAVSDDLKVLQVQLEYPLDGAYDPGEDARLFLAIANTAAAPDTLVDVTGPDFADARTGTGGDVAIEVPGNDNVYVGAEGAPELTLVDLERQLRSSQSIPVTLVFEEAGEVTVDAVVAAEGSNPAQPFDFPDPAEDPTDDG